MFTGIIRYAGTVTGFQPGMGHARLTVGAAKLATTVSHGDSVCVNGVCLTVADSSEALIEFDVIGETLRRSTLGSFRQGMHVNLEPSLRIGDSLDGHFVQGHIDGTAELKKRETRAGEYILRFESEPAIIPFLIPKGSVAIDGVSLTIADVDRVSFSVALIPTTLELTTLARIEIGDRVNIESDIIARTVVHRLQAAQNDGGLTLEHLKAHGFA